jgi:hypothetical protein
MNGIVVRHLIGIAALFWAGTAVAQLRVELPPVAAPAMKRTTDVAAVPLTELAWLAGCWRGEVNRRQFREQWMPLRGDLLVGVSHAVFDGKTESYEYLRIERRPDGVHYVLVASGAGESAFKLDSIGEDGEARIFVFVNPALEFPRQIAYRKGAAGWLYATVTGKVGGADRDIIYPMRRIDCETGDFIP